MHRSLRSADATAVRRIAEILCLFFRRRPSDRNTPPSLMEWDNDVPPYPIFTGEVRRAQATLAFLAGAIGSAS